MLRKWSDLPEDRQQAFEAYFRSSRFPKSEFVRVGDLGPILGEELFRDFLLTYDLDCVKFGTYGQFDLDGKEEIVGLIHTLNYDPMEDE